MTIKEIVEETKILRKAQGRPVPEVEAEAVVIPEMDLYRACSIIEGFADDAEQHDYHDIIKAWAFLIKHGHCWRLQGWYGRTATYDFIETGIISEDGVINWERADEVYYDN